MIPCYWMEWASLSRSPFPSEQKFLHATSCWSVLASCPVTSHMPSPIFITSNQAQLFVYRPIRSWRLDFIPFPLQFCRRLRQRFHFLFGRLNWCTQFWLFHSSSLLQSWIGFNLRFSPPNHLPLCSDRSCEGLVFWKLRTGLFLVSGNSNAEIRKTKSYHLILDAIIIFISKRTEESKSGLQ